MVEVSTGSDPVQAPMASTVQRRGSLRWYLVGAILLVAAGAAAGAWALSAYMGWSATTAPGARLVMGQTASPPAAVVRTAAPAIQRAGTDPQAAGSLSATLDDRVAAIEARLAQLSVAAEGMNGNAARAEALLIAFAVRRALDRGLALGTLESQLRLRFGDAQPNAVRTVIDAAQQPVTLERLQTEYDRLTPILSGSSGAESNLWTSFRREVGELFVVRRADAPSSRVDQRIARAQRLLDAGLVDAAAREVTAMPGAAAAKQWLGEAARYHEARRALDLIETAAILAPRDPAAGSAVNAIIVGNPVAAPRR